MKRRTFIRGLIGVAAAAAFDPHRVIFDFGRKLYLPAPNLIDYLTLRYWGVANHEDGTYWGVYQRWNGTMWQDLDHSMFPDALRVSQMDRVILRRTSLSASPA